MAWDMPSLGPYDVVTRVVWGKGIAGGLSLHARIPPTKVSVKPINPKRLVPTNIKIEPIIIMTPPLFLPTAPPAIAMMDPIMATALPT